MDSRLPLSPWASDGLFLLVRRLPGWPQAMWGHRRSYCVTSAFGDSQRTPRGATASVQPILLGIHLNPFIPATASTAVT